MDGVILEHPVDRRVTAIPADAIRATSHRILNLRGAGKVEAIVGAIRLCRPTVLITDEATAAGVLAAVGAAPRNVPD